MSGHLSPRDFELLLRRLSQRASNNLRVGSTPPFPLFEDFERLKKLGNCDLRFSTVYQLPRFLRDAGASGGKIYLLEAVGEKNRLARLNNIVNKLPLLVKKSELGLRSDAENFMDIVIGSRLNILVAAKIAPGFMRTVDWFICHDIFENEDKAHLYTIVERQDINFVKYLLGGMANMDLNRSLFGQLLFSLESAQESIGYVHYDMHTGNVFVRVARNDRQLSANFWSFVRPNGETMWISADDTNRHEPVIIDFGRNRIQSPRFTETGHRGDGTEVLFLDFFDNVGITENFNRQWDMRRFSTHLIETLLEEQIKPRKARTTAMRERSGRMTDLGPDKDYFQRLFIQSNRKEYAEFMDVLDEMSGNSDVKLRSELEKDPELKGLMYLWDFYFENLSAEYNDLTVEWVDKVLEKFRNKGISQCMKWVREDKFNKIDVISYMWSWTEFTFNSSPRVVLSMPFFKKLYVQPRAAGLVTEEVARFRPIVDVTEGVKIECAISGCANIATSLCGCMSIGYCSENCADADWAEHQHHCKGTD